MKLRRLAGVAIVAVSSAVFLMGAAGGCGSDLHKASVAADTIANSLVTVENVNHQVAADGLESTAERAAIAQYVDQVTQANDAFIVQIKAAEAAQTAGQTVSTASLVSAFNLLVTQVNALNANGVLHLSSTSAQAEFTTVMAAIQSQLAILKALTTLQTSTTSRLLHGAPPAAMAGAFTLEELDTLIALATTALGAGASLVEKLLGMKGETDTELLADATTEDAAARTEAEADESTAAATTGSGT